MSAPKHKLSSTIELEPDAWVRFTRAIDVVAKSPPQHRKAKATAKQKPSPKRKNKKSAR